MPRDDAKRTCGFCGAELPEPKGPGRRRVYCDAGHRRQAQRRRERERPSAGEGRRSLGQEIAAELHRLAGALLEATYAGEDLAELVQRARAVQNEIDCFLAAEVLAGRARGARWDDIGRAVNVTAETARSKWQADRVRRQLDHRALSQRAAPLPAPRTLASIQPSKTAVPADGPAPGTPVTARQRLAAALSQAQRESGFSIRRIADLTMLSPSFISRVLSGERLPSWDLVCHLCTIVGQEPRELRLLCEVAHGITQPARQTVTEYIASLKAALRGLHLAAARPSPQQIHRRSNGRVPAWLVAQVLNGDAVPEWEILGATVTALGGQAADFKPLWEAIHYSVLMADDSRVSGLVTDPTT
ncbi:helix-turn-helix domain-containing protein [Streptomyces sp. NBC_00654]|uniref:helix-turn-helix domain-containing protein n=1 Tax=Streptomyces sp. NBC_00654 TaxID=2975799 RepID=UPI00224CDD59|nr:helix-turn-helix transcriptional regulator [Streptomyces sp. NBC_00654]MCX4966795.1 helix-turn-helix domain-containing protein [Streptomyces sp. NBC_00654]